MSNDTNMEKDLIQLGLPPMALAEIKCSRKRKDTFIYITVLFILIGVLLYLTRSFILMDGFTTQIFFATGESKPSQLMTQQNDVDKYYDVKDGFSSTIPKRNKRDTYDKTEDTDHSLSKFTSSDYQKARDIVMNHDVICHSESKNEICKDIVTKLKSITEHENTEVRKASGGLPSMIRPDNKQSDKSDKVRPASFHTSNRESDFFRDELTGLANRNANGYGDEYSNHWPAYPIPHPHQLPLPHLADTCLLARLLKHNHPQHQVTGPYDVPRPEFLPNPSYYSQPSPPLLNKYRSSLPDQDSEVKHKKVHPQDVGIFMDYLTPKPVGSKPSFNATARDTQCPQGTISCHNGDGCILESQWCNGHVDCYDVSDEAKCSCKSRVDKSRLCDGYFDCPFGEDEMGCYGCSETAFSCEDLDVNSKTTCFLKEQRCNNIMDCPNNRDELDCNMLSPSLHNKPLFAVSNTDGFLQRNFKGDWYAVCQNPYMWAHEACRRETGLIIRPPYIQIVPVDQTSRVHYLNTSPEGMVLTSDTCFNSSAIYVTCPELLCGTRLLSSSQILKENSAIENHLFGRNKRFNGPPKRFSRDTSKFTQNFNKAGKINTVKTKRAQTRVVGGKPSQPAAWPWVTAMYRDGMFHCGGVIITQHWVLSAAHCVHKFWSHYYEIQVGMLRRFSFSPQEQNHVVSHIIVNHHYDVVDMKNDVSLLRVKTPIRFSRWVRPICLPGANTAGPEWKWGPPPGTSCTAVGWGATVEHGPDPDHLRDVELPIWANCKHPEDRVGNAICAGPLEGGKDTCQGDSGGPLLCRSPLNSQQWYVAGIVSHGDGCAHKGEAGVYTRVSLFVKWIRYHIGSNMLPNIQPIQKCPGFKCTSGVLKCLPDKRVCDKTVDCLNAEDESNCAFERSFDNLFLGKTPKDDKNILKDLTSLASEVNIQNILRESTSGDSTQKENNSNFDNKSSIKRNDQEIKNKNISNGDTNINFQHASTVELSISKSSESSSDTSEQVTVDPTSREADFIENSFMLTSPKTFLESRSSKLDNDNTKDVEINNIHSRDADIQEDFSVFNTNPTETTTATSPIVEQTPTTVQITTPSLEMTSDSSVATVSSEKLNSENNSKINEAESKSLLVDLPLDPEITPNHTGLTINKNKIDIPESKKLFTNVADKLNWPHKNNNKFNNMIHEVENIVLADLQPANIRRKHLTPKEFQCKRIPQKVPYSHRCDHKPDCEDGTDELSCTCLDFLYAFEKSLICDGIFDCADGQDESDCFSCPEDRFLCRRSQICLPIDHVCDGKPQCPQGEDEIDCFALTNGKELKYNIDERPKINLEGYLTKKKRNEWHIVCEDNLSTDQQEQASAHICHYLGFSSANSYRLKHINVKDEILKVKLDDERKKREASPSVPVHFTYRAANETDDIARHIVIKDPQVLKEHCVPNVKKTCMSLYVYCDQSLFDYDLSPNYLYGRSSETGLTEQNWPWIAKIFIDGYYTCTGVLVDLSLALVNHVCLWNISTLHPQHITVVLGSYRTLNYTRGPYEQILTVDGRHDIFHSNVVLLHLKEPAKYSIMVKPMIVHSSSIPYEHNSTCVTVGQDQNNRTLSVLVEETRESCKIHNKCYKIDPKSQPLCEAGAVSRQQWASIISCHTERGWYPTATFVDIRGECGIQDHIMGTSIEGLKSEIKTYLKHGVANNTKHTTSEDCFGVRCARGKCVDMHHLCDGVRNCEDGNDESEEACIKKHEFCEKDPHECECSVDQFRCHNAKCIPKELYNDGNNDCGDYTDEPLRSTCSSYLARVNPSGLCDGILHCKDRSDEDPMYCKCFAKRSYSCGKTSNVEHCVAPDVVCDGVPDCPNGEDEQTCIGLSAPQGTSYGQGQVMVRSHGVWHAKCFPIKNHTRSELEAICRELGFISGHARQLDPTKLKSHPYNNVLLEPFNEVQLNNQTLLSIRSSHKPLARAIFDNSLNNCYPVFLECL